MADPQIINRDQVAEDVESEIAARNAGIIQKANADFVDAMRFLTGSTNGVRNAWRQHDHPYPPNNNSIRKFDQTTYQVSIDNVEINIVNDWMDMLEMQHWKCALTNNRQFGSGKVLLISINDIQDANEERKTMVQVISSMLDRLSMEGQINAMREMMEYLNRRMTGTALNLNDSRSIR